MPIKMKVVVLVGSDPWTQDLEERLVTRASMVSSSALPVSVRKSVNHCAELMVGVLPSNEECRRNLISSVPKEQRVSCALRVNRASVQQAAKQSHYLVLTDVEYPEEVASARKLFDEVFVVCDTRSALKGLNDEEAVHYSEPPARFPTWVTENTGFFLF